MAADAIEIVLVDDAENVRALVRRQLTLSERFVVIGEGATGLEAVKLAQTHQPAVMLLDASMPDIDGLAAIPQVLAASPNTKIIMFSGFDAASLRDLALERGAVDFIEKSTPIRELPARILAAVGADVATAGVEDEELEAEVEAVLAAHLERFRTVFDQAAIGMATLTLSGTIVRANQALAALLREPEKDLIGRGLVSVADDAEHDQLRAAVLRASEHIGAAELEHQLNLAPETRWAHTTIAAVRDVEDNPLYLFAQLEDVTAQRGALEQLRISEERFRLMVDSVRDYAIFMLDTNGVITTWNLGAQRLKQYSANEIVGQHFRIFYAEQQQRERHPEHELELAMRDGRYEEEGWRFRKDGTRFWANVIITALFDHTGRHFGFAKVTRDMTERREALDKLQASEERFRLMVEAVKDYAIFMLDTDGIITTWNLGAQRLKGYSADEIIGRHFRTFYPEEQQRAKHPEYELEVAMRDGRYEEEGWRVRKDGTRLWANVVITALIDHEGKHFGFAKVTRDMTERRAAETARERNVAQLAANNEELTTAARQTEEFLAVTAHELQSPVTAINGAAEILEDYWDKLDPDERLDTLNRITASGRRIRLLLDDLLTASRLDAGKFSLSPERVSLAKVVDQALQEVKEVAGAIEVRGVDGVWVRADAGRVVQIFINLLSNAARYGASPYAVSATRNGDLVEVRVSDAGTGPSPELQTRLFQKFSKDAGSRRGTGLGLFIVRELARMQGGDAWFEQPATFAVSLPAD